MSTPASPLRILVTGAAGQLGQSLRALAPLDPSLQIRFTDRQALDIRRAEALRQWFDTHPTDIVINTAAYTAVDRAEAEPEAAMDVNAAAAGYLAEQCATRGIRLLHVSTDYVFDGRKAAPYVETDAPHPLNAYGRSKHEGEALVARLAPDALIVRSAWVFSAFGSNFLKTMLRLARERSSLQVVDDQIGGPTYAPHIAQLLLALARCSREEAPGGIYHFSGQPHVSWHAFAQAIFSEAVGLGLIPVAPILVPLPGREWPTAAQRPSNSRLDNGKLSALLGPLDCDWRTGVRHALAHLAERLPLQ